MHTGSIHLRVLGYKKLLSDITFKRKGRGAGCQLELPYPKFASCLMIQIQIPATDNNDKIKSQTVT